MLDLTVCSEQQQWSSSSCKSVGADYAEVIPVGGGELPLPLKRWPPWCDDRTLKALEVRALHFSTMVEIKHLCLVKFKEGVVVDDILQGTTNLVSEVDMAKSFEWGKDVQNQDMLMQQGFTHVFFLTFASFEDLTRYVSHERPGVCRHVQGCNRQGRRHRLSRRRRQTTAGGMMTSTAHETSSIRQPLYGSFEVSIYMQVWW
ncbi:hypothetical protein ABZP36_034283 [Zizania latifolia]